MDTMENRQKLAADEPSNGVRIRRVGAEGKSVRAAISLGLLAPKREQRADDAVLALRLDPRRATARGQTVEDGLDLVGSGVAGGAQPVAGGRVAEVAQLGVRAATG